MDRSACTRWEVIKRRNHLEDEEEADGEKKLSDHISMLISLISDFQREFDFEDLRKNLLDLRDTQPHGKDVNAASKIHAAADRMYKSCKQDDIPKDKFEIEMIEEYNKALCTYPVTSCEIVNIYNMRSILFAQRGQYMDSLNDIKLILLGPRLPERSNKVNILLRKLKCLYELKLDDKAIKVYNEIENLITPDNKDAVQDNLKRYKGLRDIITTDIDKLLNKMTIASDLVPDPGYGNVLRNTTAYVELKYNNRAGRYLKAIKTIHPGDIIISEKPLGFALTHVAHYHFCSYCMSDIYNKSFIACRNCTVARYCDYYCEAKSWVSYHRYECGLIKYFNDKIYLHIAFRLLLSIGKDGLKDMQKRLFNGYFDGNTNCVSIYDSHYISLLKLGHNSAHLHIDLFNIINWVSSLIAAFPSEFFDLELTPKFFSAMLVFHTLQCMVNSYAIYDYKQHSEVGIDCMGQIPLPVAGFAIYSNASLLNHSCISNADFLNEDRFGVVRASRTIAAGSEITITYGVDYAKQGIEERKNILYDKFGFICKCIACFIPDYELKKGSLHSLSDELSDKNAKELQITDAILILKKKVRLLPLNHPDLVECYILAGEIQLQRNGICKESINYFEHGLKIARKVYGYQAPELSVLFEHLRNSYNYKNKTKLKDVMKRNLEIYYETFLPYYIGKNVFYSCNPKACLRLSALADTRDK